MGCLCGDDGTSGYLSPSLITSQIGAFKTSLPISDWVTSTSIGLDYRTGINEGLLTISDFDLQRHAPFRRYAIIKGTFKSSLIWTRSIANQAFMLKSKSSHLTEKGLILFIIIIDSAHCRPHVRLNFMTSVTRPNIESFPLGIELNILFIWFMRRFGRPNANVYGPRLLDECADQFEKLSCCIIVCRNLCMSRDIYIKLKFVVEWFILNININYRSTGKTLAKVVRLSGQHISDLQYRTARWFSLKLHLIPDFARSRFESEAELLTSRYI